MVDWGSEINAADSAVERALKNALAESKTWNHCVVVYIEELSDHLEAVGWINAEPSTVLDDVKLLEAAKFAMLNQWLSRRVEGE